MKSLALVLRVGLFLEFVTITWSSPVIPQVETRAQSDQSAPKSRSWSGTTRIRAIKLEEEFAKARTADRWDEAISKAQELVALRTRGQGAAHFETVRAEWQLKTARRVAALPREDRAAFLSARRLGERGSGTFWTRKIRRRAAPIRTGPGDPPQAFDRRPSRYRTNL